jgi:hypothetical protein
MANLPTLPTLPTQAILHKGSSSVGNSVGNSIGNSNLPTSHKPLHSKDYVGSVGNVGKFGTSSRGGDQPDDKSVHL